MGEYYWGFEEKEAGEVVSYDCGEYIKRENELLVANHLC